MGKKIENLRWKPRWVSHLGCIKGCLEYLNIDVSAAWLYGATGHAFIINIHEVVCPSGPTAWNTEMLPKLGENIGYSSEKIFSRKSDDDFSEKQELACEKAKSAIDEGLPCYAWYLKIPEFYVIHGYDATGYYFLDPECNSAEVQKPWKELGDNRTGILEMYIVRPGEATDDKRTVREAIDFALEHAKSPPKWIYPKYKAGLWGFDTWIHALETGEARGFCMAYNAPVWRECRTFAVQFLKEAKQRIGGNLGSLFDKAISHYKVVAENLKMVADAFPFHLQEAWHIKDKDRCHTASVCLRAARNAEESGLKALEKILTELQEETQ